VKQRSQATGSVETSNSTYKFLSRADTIRRQAVAHRNLKFMSPTTSIRSTGGTVLLSHRWRHSQQHREKTKTRARLPSWPPAPEGAHGAVTADGVVTKPARPAHWSSTKFNQVGTGRQSATNHHACQVATLVQPGRALHCSSQGKVPLLNSPKNPALLVVGIFNSQGAHARGAGKVSGHAIGHGSSYAV